jgi:hypothetical protein
MSRALPNDSSLSLNKRTNLTAAGGNIGFSPSKIAPPSDIGVVIPSRIIEEDPVAADGGDFLYERQQIEERRLDLARELEEESRKRRESEDQLERIKDEYYKRELEESRARSEL